MLNIQDFFRVLNKYISQRKKGRKKIDYGIKVSQSGIGAIIRDSVKL